MHLETQLGPVNSVTENPLFKFSQSLKGTSIW